MFRSYPRKEYEISDYINTNAHLEGLLSMRDAEIAELKSWNSTLVKHQEATADKVEELREQVTLLRDALIYAKTQLTDIIDTRLVDEALTTTMRRNTMKLNPDHHTITAVVVEYKAGNGRPTLGQATIGELPQYLIDAIHRFNARPLGELLSTDTSGEIE